MHTLIQVEMLNTEDKKSTEVIDVSKYFNNTKVVDNISFSVAPGEIFGLIGPNGAGKTTTIRMIMDIIKADTGRIKVLGEIPTERVKNNIGYLPEERGLYNKLSVIKTLTYLATLKGMQPRQSHARADELLERVGLSSHRTKKIAELSRGMSQLVQFLTTIIHSPSLLILDEPFANLDPVNTELLKEIIYDMREQGCSIILSTHRMNEVEELCDRIFMIHRGKGVLYGELGEIKSHFHSNSILLSYEGKLNKLEGVSVRSDKNGTAELLLENDTLPQQVLEQIVSQGIKITRFEVATPPLHDIFLQVVGESDE